MYRINRDFGPYLQEEEIPALVKLEINEYTRRAKREKIPKAPRLSSSVCFEDIETAIREGERAKAAALLNGFLEQKGGSELARKLLLLGSGYLDDSLSFRILYGLHPSGDDGALRSRPLAGFGHSGRLFL